MGKRLMAIDPGASGGIAWEDYDGTVKCRNMPEGMTEQCDCLRWQYGVPGFYECILEKVGTYVKGNAVGGACKFARHCGALEAALYCFDIPVRQVAPTVWQRALGTFSKDKATRKREIRELMARRYPHLSVTLKTADALGILTWAIHAEGGAE